MDEDPDDSTNNNISHNFFQQDNSNTWPRQRFQPNPLVMDADHHYPAAVTTNNNNSDNNEQLPHTAADAKSFFEAMFSIPSVSRISNSPNPSSSNGNGINKGSASSGNGSGTVQNSTNAVHVDINVPPHLHPHSHSQHPMHSMIPVHHHHQHALMNQQQQQQSRPISAPPARELVLLGDDSVAVGDGNSNINNNNNKAKNHLLTIPGATGAGVYRSQSVGVLADPMQQQQFNGIGLNQRRPSSTSDMTQQFQQLQMEQQMNVNQRMVNFSPAPGGGMSSLTNVNLAPPGITLQRPSSAFEGSSSSSTHNHSSGGNYQNHNNNNGFLLSPATATAGESAMYSVVGTQLRRPASTGLIGLERNTPKTLMDLIQEENSPSPSVPSNGATPQPNNNGNQRGSEGVYQHFSDGPAPTVNGTRIQYVSAQNNQNQQPQPQQHQQQQQQNYMNVYNNNAPLPMHHILQHPHLQQPQQHQMQYLSTPAPALYYNPSSSSGDHHPIYVNAAQAAVASQYYTSVPFTTHLPMQGQPQQRLVAMGGHPEYTLVPLSQQQQQHPVNSSIQSALPYWSDPVHGGVHHHHHQNMMVQSHSSGSSQQNIQQQRQGNETYHQDKMANDRNRVGPSNQGNTKSGGRGGHNGKRGGDMGVSKNSKFNTLLEELGLSKTRPTRVEDIKGHIVAFCKDQNGSRFIQQRLEVADSIEKDLVMDEVGPRIRELRDDVFGNYVIQKLFQYRTDNISSELTKTLYGEMRTLCRQMYGCRVLQTALESLDDNIVIGLVEEFEGHVVSCVHDQNGNHVIQKCVEVLSKKTAEGNKDAEAKLQFILNEVLENTINISCHPYGCRVLQRVLEHCTSTQRNRALDAISRCHRDLLDDQYGNYVVQHVLKYGRDSDRESILALIVEGGLLTLSRQKFASNVVEKLLQFGSASQRNKIVVEMLKKHGNEDETVVLLMVRDAYANYVVQTTLDVVPEGDEKGMLLKELNTHSDQLRQYTFAKHIVTKLGTGDIVSEYKG